MVRFAHTARSQESGACSSLLHRRLLSGTLGSTLVPCTNTSMSRGSAETFILLPAGYGTGCTTVLGYCKSVSSSTNPRESGAHKHKHVTLSQSHVTQQKIYFQSNLMRQNLRSGTQQYNFNAGPDKNLQVARQYLVPKFAPDGL